MKRTRKTYTEIDPANEEDVFEVGTVLMFEGTYATHPDRKYQTVVIKAAESRWWTTQRGCGGGVGYDQMLHDLLRSGQEIQAVWRVDTWEKVI